jgi:hypothetical protein
VSDSCAEMSSCRNYHHVTRDVEHANKASAQECTAPMQPPVLDGVLHGKGSKQFPAQTLGASTCSPEAAPEKYTIGRRRNVTIVTGTRNSLVFVAMTPRYRCGARRAQAVKLGGGAVTGRSRSSVELVPCSARFLWEHPHWLRPTGQVPTRQERRRQARKWPRRAQNQGTACAGLFLPCRSVLSRGRLTFRIHGVPLRLLRGFL